MWLEWLHLLQESVNKNWIRLHWPSYAFIGDIVVSVNNITRWGSVIIPEWTHCKIESINIKSQHWGWVWFSKKIEINGIGWEFSPKKFRKV